MIWSGTTHLGMGLAVSSSGTTYVVARYSPRGNYVGQSPAQGSKSGGKQIPTPGRQHLPGQRDSGRKHGKHGGFQPPFQHSGSGGMQSPWPYQPFPPGSSGYTSPYQVPPPQVGIPRPHDVNNWMSNPYLGYSPYSPFGPLANPHRKRASAAHAQSAECCTIM